MRIINQDELKHDPKLIEELKKSVFIYPTDTIYGIGCDATNHKLVAKVRAIKQSFEQPFSVIIPNKNMIFEFCEPTEEARAWIDKLPGPYTLIFKIKKKCVAENVNPDIDTIGIRIPDHWFYNFIKKMKVPIVTTSANITGDNFMTNLEDLNPDMKNKVDFIIDDGEHKGRGSTIVNLSKDEVEVRER
ncbi:MAG: threonylcarbamoyl-AMP synthase [Nanoarchaeota archaeon]|nr:threonylcarbamoyl-AMP synthase [Nanoarchaeota archaeon]MBU1321875.1 threonylcarbamoyl-AMP synthase [Nanoarchaeota archaeon]MBU1597650.1 threonylcarbamoyl-AMP synthase [Nanoarchaeota archaeon]MBU2442213.1 threonylcarbamoyl-AMP synthase [Nanoarchaeota archaeon]